LDVDIGQVAQEGIDSYPDQWEAREYCVLKGATKVGGWAKGTSRRGPKKEWTIEEGRIKRSKSRVHRENHLSFLQGLNDWLP
jgi:hypothetical protein